MLSFLANGLSDGIVAVLDRPRRAWLRGATKDSVLDALKVELFEGISEFGPVLRNAGPKLVGVFDRYGSLNLNDNRRYWREDDLASLLRDHFHQSTISATLNGSISLLWRCFHFHAYFPFPEQFPDQIDCAAFQRAVALLATDGALRLGCIELGDLGMQSDPDRDLLSSHIWRVFRSLAIPNAIASSADVPNEGQSEQQSQVDDLLDVLHLVHPPGATYGCTYRDELRPHASRILGPTVFQDSTNRSVIGGYFIPRGEFLGLLSLLLSIHVNEGMLGASFMITTARLPHGLDEELPERLAKAILHRFAPDENSDIEWPIFQDMLSNYLINLPSQMRLIFSSFISNTASETPDHPHTTHLLSSPFIQYLGLLNPPYPQQRSTYPQKLQYTLQNPTFKAAYSETSTFCATTFATALSTIKNPSLLFLTGSLDPKATTPPASTSTSTPTTTTFAIPMPFPWPPPNNTNKPESTPQPPLRIGASHALFQLEPSLQILRPKHAWSPTSDMIALSSSSLEFGSNTSFSSCDKERRGGLVIDFESGVAVLSSLRRGSEGEGESESGYRDVVAAEGEGGKGVEGRRDWETTMRIRAMEVYELAGAAPDLAEELGDRRKEDPRVLAVATNAERDKGAGPKVGGEELKRRIMGIGPRLEYLGEKERGSGVKGSLDPNRNLESGLEK